MTRKEFERYLDRPDTPLQDPENQDLARLMDEVSQCDAPDPGPEYWNQFNHRLQQRLDQEPIPKQRARLPLFAWLAPLATAIAVVALFWLIPHQKSVSQAPSLDQLDSESLAFLGSVFDETAENPQNPLLEEDAVELWEDEWDFDPLEIDPESLKNDWDMEG